MDAGLAGFTDVMVSKRLDQYVIVPLPLVVPPPEGAIYPQEVLMAVRDKLKQEQASD